MKIRLGFVSNSSSASFTIWWSFRPHFIDDIIKKIGASSRKDPKVLHYAIMNLLHLDFHSFSKKTFKDEDGFQHYDYAPFYDEDKYELTLDAPEGYSAMLREYYSASMVKDILSKTTITESGAFRTEFFTSMMNCSRDFGPNFEQFMSAIHVYTVNNNDIEIVDKKIDKNGH
jgi:hypothetical protein